MGEVTNCPYCGTLFIQTKFRDLCETCFKAEEEEFETVHKYIRKKENRTASIQEVVGETGVEEEVIVKFIRSGRLKVAKHPNIGYNCSRCGSTIQYGTLCTVCSTDLRKQLADFVQEEQREREGTKGRPTYYTKE